MFLHIITLQQNRTGWIAIGNFSVLVYALTGLFNNLKFLSQNTVNNLLLVISGIWLFISIEMFHQKFGKTKKRRHFVEDRQPLHSNGR